MYYPEGKIGIIKDRMLYPQPQRSQTESEKVPGITVLKSLVLSLHSRKCINNREGNLLILAVWRTFNELRTL